MSGLKKMPKFIAALFTLSLWSNDLSSADVGVDRLLGAENEPQNWMIYSGTYNAWRYSSLSQINRSNVEQLVPKWVFQTGVVDGGFSCTPLVVDGVMYITSPVSYTHLTLPTNREV